MTAFTQEQLSALAVFAGGRPGKTVVKSWCFPDEGIYINQSDWLPHVRPEQTDLIIEALLGKGYFLTIYPRVDGSSCVVNLDSDVPLMEKVGGKWPNALCLAALELIQKEKKNGN